ncbi:MAG: response regulator [Candidatus Hatepunaea meridiana]|nr:response regulator [Candidatus Hatepunaea meridiana]
MPLNGTSILLIDDEQLIVDMLTAFLDQNGYDVTGLTDSKAALKLINARDFDIVLTDLKMPDVSGLEIAKAVKATGGDTQVIIFTGYASIDSAIEAIRQGVYDYIRKPFRLEEMLFTVNRAAEKLALKRENIAYQKRIEKILSDITMLVDISSILYQIPDYDMALDMILDTLTEGIKVKRVGLFLNSESNDTFIIRKSKGLTSAFIDKFRFRSSDTINNIPISLKEPTVLTDIKNGLFISNKKIEKEQNLTCCFLIPIRYTDALLGFMGIFQIDEEVPTVEDEVRLLKVLSTQVAPIFQALETEIQVVDDGDLPFDSIIMNAVKNELSTAAQLNSYVSFTLLKMTNADEITHLSSVQNLDSSFKKIVLDECNSIGELISLNPDFILIVFPGGNPVDIELSCVSIQRRIKEISLKEKDNSIPSVKYAIMTYPMDGSSISGIINGLWMKLLNELGKSE